MRSVAAIVALVLNLGACSTANGPDPGQSVNRSIFGFNEGFDKTLLAPVATGWDFVMPDFAISGIDNFFENLRMPRTLFNDLFQAKPQRAVQDFGRFVVNTTAGIVGLIDVATRLDIPHNREDFGQTLNRWGAPSGAYVMIPLLGPSTVRDTIALPIDFVMVPSLYGSTLIDVINVRARYLEEVERNRELAVDYYVFIRSAYLQNREASARDGGADDADEDLYEITEDQAAITEEAAEGAGVAGTGTEPLAATPQANP